MLCCFELRAVLSLAKLYQSTGRPADAYGLRDFRHLQRRREAFERRREDGGHLLRVRLTERALCLNDCALQACFRLR